MIPHSQKWLQHDPHFKTCYHGIVTYEDQEQINITLTLCVDDNEQENFNSCKITIWKSTSFDIFHSICDVCDMYL